MPFVWGDYERRKRRRLPRAGSPHGHKDKDRDCCSSHAGSSCCSVSRLADGDPGARGLHDHECFRGEDRRLWHCTETLGSESCDMVPEEEAAEWAEVRRRSRLTRRRAEKRRTGKREFPPPLRWLEEPGRGVMLAERRDGRLILTEVRIERTGLLREDGHLRLHRVEPEGCRAPEEEEEEETAAAEERWELKREGVLRRCSRAAAGGRGEAARWWDHLCVTMAKV